MRLLRGIAGQKDPQVETYNKVESELGIHQQDVAMLETQYLTQMMHNKQQHFHLAKLHDKQNQDERISDT